MSLNGFIMKKIPLYVFLLTLNPIITLYAQLPGGIPFQTTMRVFFFQLLATVLFVTSIYGKTKNLERSCLTTGLLFFYFSSTGYFLRLIPIPVPSWAHLLLVFIGVSISVVFAHPLLWGKYLTQPFLRMASPYMNMIALVSLLVPLYQISRVIFKGIDDARTPWSEIIRAEMPPQSLSAENPPDVYYIILDGYTRADVLKDVFRYDNSPFLNELSKRGFYVAEQSRSNYIRTAVSIPSSLNMNYLNFTEEQAGWDSTNYLPLYDLFQNNQTRLLLEEMGFITATVASDYAFTDWQDADIYRYPNAVKVSEFERVYMSITALGAFYDTELPFTDQLRSILPLPSYGTRRERIEYAFEQLSGLPLVEEHKFVFVHIIAPHPPFVFNAEGDPVTTNRPYAPGDAEDFAGDVSEYQSQYIEQLQYVNQKVIKTIDSILTSSKTPPVIIIQGDHGSGSLLSPTSLEDSCLFERTSILNAYYMPGGKTELLYPSITPVNSFRVVFDTYFGANYPLLPDKTYYSPHVNPYNFIEITDQIENSCDN